MIPVDPTVAITVASALGLSPAAGKLLERALGPAADDVGEIIRAKVNSRRNRVIERAAAKLNEAKIEPREVPLRLLGPIVQHAALEDDENLADKWAALLANAAAGEKGADVSQRFAHILSLLTPLEARFFEMVANPKVIANASRMLGGRPVSMKEALEQAGFADPDLLLLVNSLLSHGLFQKIGAERTPSGAVVWKLDGRDRYEISPLGMAFLRACTMPGEVLPPGFGTHTIEFGS
jgi:hypothetical protein